MGSRFCDALAVAYFNVLSRIQGEGHEPAAVDPGPIEFRGLHRGQVVAVPWTDGAFEYGGDMPFGGVIERFWPGCPEGEVEISFFSEGEDGWGWSRWQFHRDSVEPVYPEEADRG